MNWLNFCIHISLIFGDVQEVRTCEQVAIVAQDMGMCPYLAMAIAYRESRFTANSQNGRHFGAMQVNPRWSTCEDCTEIEMAIDLFLKFKTKNLCDWVARYGAGVNATCNDQARSRIKLANRLKKMHKKLLSTPSPAKR